MNPPVEKKLLRAIPQLDDVLGDARLTELRRDHPRFPWTHLGRSVVEEFRRTGGGLSQPDRGAIKSYLIEGVKSRFEELRRGGMRRVLNGTGVILHTNLGRAVLGRGVRDAALEAMSHYVNLEVDLESGKRDKRGKTLNDLIELATGAESAMVVNNNAAAVYLAVNTYSPPGRVLVSRGELVEIGGSFRLPDILARAAAEVVEVGTTNRTYLKDYAGAARTGDILLKVHRSNYDIKGFTHETPVTDLVSLARERNCHVVYDLGSGALFDFATAGMRGEEVVSDVVRSGVDCVTMSGDKLLGGVQAGIIVGRGIFLARLKHNPLRRALRVDKIAIAALQSLLRSYLFGDAPVEEIPVLKQSTEMIERLRSRAQEIVDGLPAPVRNAYAVCVVDDAAAIGGGSFACEDLPSLAIAIRCQSESAAEAMAKRMRNRDIPMLSRIKGSEVRVNLRTILPEEDADLLDGLNAVLADQ